MTDNEQSLAERTMAQQKARDEEARKIAESDSARSEQRQRTFGLIRNLARREISSQYKRTVLGRVWSLLNPLASIAVYAMIFGVVFRGGAPTGRGSGIESYALWIAVGVLAWGFFSNAIMSTMNSFVSNQALLTKVYFPRYVLPVSKMISNVVNHLPEMAVLLVIVIIVSGPRVILYLPVLAVVIALASAFALGLGLFLAVGMIYFRDLEYLWGIINQVWMYASGVVFPLTMLETVATDLQGRGISLGGEPLPLVNIFRTNPAELYLELYRGVFYDVALPTWNVWAGATAWSLLALFAGVTVYRRFSDRIVEEL
ncbi:MAG: ABC transporter permease [Actinomycetaceae bacterium]|nr:ABC transporter permease [Actinomycetaceae bacterium]